MVVGQNSVSSPDQSESGNYGAAGPRQAALHSLAPEDGCIETMSISMQDPCNAAERFTVREI